MLKSRESITNLANLIKIWFYRGRLYPPPVKCKLQGHGKIVQRCNTNSGAHPTTFCLRNAAEWLNTYESHTFIHLLVFWKYSEYLSFFMLIFIQLNKANIAVQLTKSCPLGGWGRKSFRGLETCYMMTATMVMQRMCFSKPHLRYPGTFEVCIYPKTGAVFWVKGLRRTECFEIIVSKIAALLVSLLPHETSQKMTYAMSSLRNRQLFICWTNFVLLPNTKKNHWCVIRSPAFKTVY